MAMKCIDQMPTPIAIAPPVIQAYWAVPLTGVLILATQTTKGMGIYPDEDGHDCISDLIFEADNGWGILKNKLGIPEPAEEPCE